MWYRHSLIVNILETNVWCEHYWSACNNSSSRTCTTHLIRILLLSSESLPRLALDGLVHHPWRHYGVCHQPLLGGGVPLHEHLEFSLLIQFFYLFFQIATFISVMVVILMKTIVLLRVLNWRSVIEVGSVFPNEKMKLGLLSLASKVVIITWSSISSISNTALLKCFT